MSRRRRVQKSGLQTHEFPASFGARRFPKGNEGKRVSSGYNRRRRLATRSSGKQQAERTAVRTAPIVCPEGSPLVRPQAQNFFPAGGLTRRLRRGSRACSPMGRSHFSFVGERKVCKRKPAARRLREKALYCPFWRRGSLCRAQRSWPATPAIVRARSSPFSAVKMGGPFSLRCLSPLCSPAVGVVQTYPLRVGRFVMTWIFLHRKRPAWFQIHAGLFKRAMRPVAEWR